MCHNRVKLQKILSVRNVAKFFPEFASGLTYTGLSRAKKFQNVKFDPFPSEQRIKNIFTTNKFKKRVKEEERIGTLSII